MVVLSASLLNKAGKPLMARQFVDMSRIRIEGLLAAFPKLINTNHQHTYVETESVRYVYQPMEQLYLLLITNKSSNIMEDLETLRLLAKLVPEFCPELDEEGVREESFEIMLAFDEVLAMGHRETINLQQVKTALEMESHEEKLHQMIRQSKINEAKEEAKRKAQSIDQAKAQRGGGSGMAGMGSSMGAISSAFQEEDRAPRSYQPEATYQEKPERKAPPKGKGMQLGSKSKVTLEIHEKVSVKMSKDGALESLEVKGELKMTVQDGDAAYTRVQVLSDVRVIVPCPAAATVAEVGEGDARYLAKSATVEWRVEMVDDSNRSGSLEFSVASSDIDALFPISVNFNSNGTMCQLKVESVTDARSGAPIQFLASAALGVEEFEIA
ncbi:Longin-like domain-containing protein [Baffinella frigidus]|nr:Longin-like domain-containing protein [Cryptophyta sp. CCMP2293]